jgi:O-antigen ligase
MGLTWTILMTFYFQALVISPADMSERINRSAVYAAGVFVFVNLVLYLLGIRSPDELFLAKYPAQMLSLLGILTYRVVFPMASGFNSFGNLAGAALASLPFILRDRTTRTPERIMVCVLLVSSLVSLLLTDSRGPLFFSAVTLGLMILPKQLFSVLRWVLIGATILLPFLLINPPPFLVEKMSFLSRPASEWQEQAIETTEDCSPLASESSGFLTNRTAIWKATVADLSFTNPYSYIGYGFRGQLISGVSKKYSCLFTSYENQIFISSHQMWLQTIMDIGIIGLAITLIAFVFLILELDRDQTYPVKGANSAYSAYLLYIVAIGTLESSLYPDAFELFIIVFLLLTGTVVKKRRVENMTNRIHFKDLSIPRVLGAASARIGDIPHRLSWSFSGTANDSRELLRGYKNKHSGQRCFIVANGPSLQRTDLSRLTNEITFGLNRIYLNFKTNDFRPSYYVAVNELVVSQFYEEIQQLSMPKFINFNCHKHFQKINGEIIFIKPKLVLDDYFEPDVTKPFVFGGTVTYTTLQLAFYMGFSEVIIIGLDHKYSEKGTPNEKETRKYEHDTSHFSPEYFPKGIKWQLPDLVRSEIDFSLARKFYEKANRHIIDATVDGNCPVFDKVLYESLFK